MIKRGGITLLLICLLGLTACGFSPLYGQNGLSRGNSTTTAALNQIEIANIPDRAGQALKNALIDRFYAAGTPATPTYLLTISPLVENRADLDITVDDESTRRQLKLSTSFVLTDTNDPATPLLTRSVYIIVSFNVLQSQFTTRVAEQNARDSAIADLARQIEQAIVIYLNNPLSGDKP